MSINFKFIFIIPLVILFSCRGTTSENPPIHLIQNMDDVGRQDPQSQNFASYEVEEEPFDDLNNNSQWDEGEPFDDLNENHHWDPSYTQYINEHKMSMIDPLNDVINRENDDSQITNKDVSRMSIENTGKNNKGNFIEDIPSKYTQGDFIDRGENRYNIYCTPCHGLTGDGQGIVMNENYSWNKNIKPGNLQDLSDKDDSCKDGYLFDVITHGKGNMKGYASQISVEDRWKIVAYVRALSIASGVDYSCCDEGNLKEIKNTLNVMTTLEEKLLSSEFLCLIELGEVQKVFKKDMIAIQKIVKCDSYDGEWGAGTRNKWKKWKEETLY